MINIYLKSDKNLISEVVVKGHAGYAEEGYDIICASVSSVVQTAVLGLVRVLDLKIDYKTKDGYLKCTFKPNDKTQIIMATMLEGLMDMEKQYPQYIKIMEA